MRSLLMVCDLDPKKAGAFETYLVAMADRCRRDGVRYGLLLAGEPIPPVAAALSAAGATWSAAHAWNDSDGRERPRVFARAYHRVLRERGPWDVVAFQFCNEVSVVAASLAARAMRIGPRSTVWVQHSQMAMPGRVARRLSRLRLLRWAVDRMVLLAEAGRLAAVARGWPVGRAAVIPNGITPRAPARRGRVRELLGLPPGGTILTCVGSLIPRKGYDVLLAALVPLLATHRDWHLVIAGDGPEREAVARQAAEAGVAGQIHLLGLRDDVPDMLADSDLFVLASHAEGLTLAVLEAMAAGLPVVVTAVGGHAEVVTSAVGLVVPPGDPVAFRAAVEALLADRPRLVRMGTAGPALVRAGLTLDHQIDAQFRYFQGIRP